MVGQTLKEYVEAHCVAIDRDMFMLMWNVIEGDEWIYLDREFIKSSLTEDKSKNGVCHFYTRKLFSSFQKNIEYKEYESKDLIKTAANIKFYLVTKKTFITLLCTAKTTKSARYLSFLYELQLLVVQYYKSQYDDYKGALSVMLEAEAIVRHTREQAVKEIEAKRRLKDKVGVVYFVHEDSDQNRYKIGYTFNMAARLPSLQVGNFRELKYGAYIFCQNPEAVEAEIHETFSGKKLRGEWFSVNADEVSAMIEQYAG